MPQQYDFSGIEAAWQKRWKEQNSFQADDDGPGDRFYCLSMYPYPSGVLHMGHMLAYTVSDVITRYRKMCGRNVLCPMGWDSFGLPAENAAIRAQIHPNVITRDNIERMHSQMDAAGWGYDWRREIATSTPEYYRWNQWIFTRFFEKGLAVRKKAPVNWCPSCNTVLANEQVIQGGCERCNTTVEQRDLEQWFFRMSEYAERLLNNIEPLRGHWPERVLKMQEEWIGRSEGARIDFTITETGEKLPIFTTRPDTVYGVTFMSLAPEHPLIEKLLKGTPQENTVIDAALEMRRVGTSERESADIEKVGVDTGFHVTNPVNDESVPLWVANFALMEYGTGAVMAVPAHDQRDFEFARKYGLAVKVVINPPDEKLDPNTMTEAYVEDGVQVASGPFDGIPNREAIPKMIAYFDEQGYGSPEINYRLRDWLISRQRYWGTPIPIVYCEKCGEVPVPDENLPVLLPENVEFRPTGESPLASCEEFVNTACPKCGGAAKRETDTMDTFVDSSWYYLRYLSPDDDTQPFDIDKVKKWIPVAQYVGGVEHATMHLVYVRFFTHALHDLGLLPFEEPVKDLFCQGMVCKEAHFCEACKWVSEEKVKKDGDTLTCETCGGSVRTEMSKISKTKLNTVDPDKMIAKYGADTMRLYMVSDAPPDKDQFWSDEGVRGAHRFLKRLWTTINDIADEETPSYAGNGADLGGPGKDLYKLVHRTVKKVTEEIESNYHFNTAVSSVFEMLRALRESADAAPEVRALAAERIVQLLAPFTPHICAELWKLLGHDDMLVSSPWPSFDEDAARSEDIEIAVQINGKLRATVTVDAGAAEEDVVALALAQEKVQAHIDGKNVVKKIYVPGRLVNVVVK
ncbi:leucine--tRNA ligase [Planctomycetota bacterium]